MIWLGISFCRVKSNTVEAGNVTGSSYISSFLAGFLITLGDQKAILFYLIFFPAFIDLSTLSLVDVGIVIAVAFVAIVCAKLGYAFMAIKAKLFVGTKANQVLNIIAGIGLIFAGIYLILKGYSF